MIPYTMNENSLTYFYQGRQKTIASDHVNFNEIKEAVISGEEHLLNDLVNIRQIVALATFGTVVIGDDDVVYFKSKPVPDYLGQRIIAMYRDNPKSVSAITKFAEKLMHNPNAEVREDLYKWLEVGKMPIWPDGDIVAYKVVRADFTPVWTGPYGKDQSPGKIVEMPRQYCNGNRNITCSTGLHFCSYEYLPHFGWADGNRKVILLKINPADVVAIPTDYNLTKGRCCRFEVVSEIDPATIAEDFGDRLLLSTHDWEEDHDAYYEDGEDFDQYYEQQVEIDNAPNTSTHESDYKAVVIRAVDLANGNKTQAAKNLGIARSTLYKWLNQ